MTKYCFVIKLKDFNPFNVIYRFIEGTSLENAENKLCAIMSEYKCAWSVIEKYALI